MVGSQNSAAVSLYINKQSQSITSDSFPNFYNNCG